VLTHWVWDMQQEVDRTRLIVVQGQMKNLDGDQMVVARQTLIDALERLSTSMRNYNATVGADESLGSG